MNEGIKQIFIRAQTLRIALTVEEELQFWSIYLPGMVYTPSGIVGGGGGEGRSPYKSDGVIVLPFSDGFVRLRA